MPAIAFSQTVVRGRDESGAVREALLPFLAESGVDALTLYKFEVVIEESFVNLAWHAFDDDGEHDVEIEVNVGDAQLVLTIADDGIAFDPTKAIEPARPASLDDAVPGGLGLVLVRKLAHSVDYERHCGKNRLTVRLARPATAEHIQ